MATTSVPLSTAEQVGLTETPDDSTGVVSHLLLSTDTGLNYHSEGRCEEELVSEEDEDKILTGGPHVNYPVQETRKGKRYLLLSSY